MTHAFINVLIPFASEHSEHVNTVLRGFTKPETGKQADQERGNRPNERIEKILWNIGTVHFMSITVVEPTFPAERNGPPVDPVPSPLSENSHLLIEISADRGTEETLSLLADQFKDQLQQIFRVADIEHGDKPLGSYLMEHSRVIGAGWHSDTLGQVFTGSPGQSVERIAKEEILAARIGAIIEQDMQDPVWITTSVRQRLERIRGRIWEEGEKWAFVPEPAPCLPGDPHNKWDPNYAISNRQARKALLTIFNMSLGPLYLPILLLAVAAFARGWWVYDPTVALTRALWVIFAAIALLVCAFGAVYLWLRRLERTDTVDDRTPPTKQVEDLMKVENFCAQNHLASVSRLKPGLLRRLTLRLAFIVVGTGRFLCAPGFLGKNGVIHFARWMRLPGTDQLVFLSNFDGTWESYVADFIADAPTGVTAIWSNCVGFPCTRGLFGGGATNRDQLVRWARRQQHPALFWYSAYRDLTAERIRINAAIRQGLASAESDADVRDWFDLFGSAPRPAEAPRDAEIPTLVHGGLSRLRFARCLAIRFCENDFQKSKEWLAVAEAAATYGELRPDETTAIVVALSASGLRKLGVPDNALETFPVAFQQGMWPEWRARALGDFNGSAPNEWQWGFEDKIADALLYGYGRTAPEVDAALNKLLELANKLGHTRVHDLPLKPLPERSNSGRREFPREPFGFADGVSQPVIRGTRRAMTNADSNDLVARGEIVLGYPDNLGKIPPSPSIAAENDAKHLLPDVGIDPTRRRPEFSRYEGIGRRDLGANGSFLVVRQLKQEVDKFDKWLETAVDEIGTQAFVAVDQPIAGNATTLENSDAKRRPPRMALLRGTARNSELSTIFPWPQSASSELSARQIQRDDRDWLKSLIAAKLIGRWQDGTSLVRHPLLPGTREDFPTQPDNDFLLGSEDPRGLSCPFGAHIRRANPRDTRFQGNDPAEIATINRHRMLRVGRAYNTSSTEDSDQGLLFMCLNADIERQFEFVQKTWILNPNIHGLENEMDPIMGHGSRNLTIPTPTGPIVLHDLPDFVTTKGGGYFFLPGRTALRYLSL